MEHEILAACKVAVYRASCGLDLTEKEIRKLMEAIGKVHEQTKVETFEQAVDSVLSDLRNVMIAKQRDYGHRNILDCGLIGVIIRLNDKVARLRNLCGITNGTFQIKEAANESIEDSMIDAANYGIIYLMLMRGIFDRPLSEVK